MSIFDCGEEWPGADAWVKDPVDGPEHYSSFIHAGFLPEDAGKLACKAVDQGYFNVVRDLQKLEGISLECLSEIIHPPVVEQLVFPLLPKNMSSALSRTVYAHFED